MSILQINRPNRRLIPDPIVATKVPREIQKAFDQLATKNYRCTRAELLRALILDFLERHEVEIK